MTLILTQPEVELIREYIAEMDAIIEADDGTYFPMGVLNIHEEIKEIFYD